MALERQDIHGLQREQPNERRSFLFAVIKDSRRLSRGDRQVLVVFHQMPYFLQHFAKNWVKTLVHSTLQKKLLISRRSTSFGGFSPNAILFATFC